MSCKTSLSFLDNLLTFFVGEERGRGEEIKGVKSGGYLGGFVFESICSVHVYGCTFAYVGTHTHVYMSV